MSKLTDLFKGDKEASTELEAIKTKAREEGVSFGRSEALKEFKASSEKKTEEKEVKTPECFKKYKETYEKQPRVCRACPFSQKCKGKK